MFRKNFLERINVKKCTNENTASFENSSGFPVTPQTIPAVMMRPEFLLICIIGRSRTIQKFIGGNLRDFVWIDFCHGYKRMSFRVFFVSGILNLTVLWSTLFFAVWKKKKYRSTTLRSWAYVFAIILYLDHLTFACFSSSFPYPNKSRNPNTKNSLLWVPVFSLCRTKIIVFTIKVFLIRISSNSLLVSQKKSDNSITS